MSIQCKIIVIFCLFTLPLLFVGCQESANIEQETETVIDANTTIGSLAEVFSLDAIPVEGYAVVGGLKGTGSSECPQQIRAYLEKYIRQQLPEESLNIDEFISSQDTAVVMVKGTAPTAASEDPFFDVGVIALPGTQTTSLEGGWLYGADLKLAGKFGMTLKVLATAKGPVFTDKISEARHDNKFGYILAGGKVKDKYKINLTLRKPDYETAALIRNQLNGRFGDDMAEAISPSEIELKIPSKYQRQKRRFVSIVRAIYLTGNTQLTEQRILKYIKELAVKKNKYRGEIALEAIGNKSLGKLAALLNSSSQEVRFRVARCMLNLNSDKGLEVLREIASDENSSYRLEALKAVTAGAQRNDAASISRNLLSDNSFFVRLTAYEQLRQLDDISIKQELIARNFFLEQITQARQKTIFVSRSGRPKIVLFGAPLYCKEDVFVQSDDGNITINAPAGQKYVSIIHKHPTRKNVVINMKSSFELSDIIKTLCEESSKKSERRRAGLEVTYSEMISLLKKMCRSGAIEAEFYAGPLPKF